MGGQKIFRIDLYLTLAYRSRPLPVCPPWGQGGDKIAKNGSLHQANAALTPPHHGQSPLRQLALAPDKTPYSNGLNPALSFWFQYDSYWKLIFPALLAMHLRINTPKNANP